MYQVFTSIRVFLGGLWPCFRHRNCAFALHHITVDAYPREHPGHAIELSHGLAKFYYARFESSGDTADLDRAIVLWRDALQSCPQNHRSRFTLLASLARAISLRNECSRKPKDLDELIELQRAVLSLLPHDSADHFTLSGDLRTSLIVRFRRNGHIDDLSEMISILRGTLESERGKSCDRASSLCSLASYLHTRFELIRNFDDLTESISVHRDSLALLPDGHPMHPPLLSRLANSLQIRFGEKGNLDDLKEAIDQNRLVLDIYPDDHPSRCAALHDLGTCLLARFKHSGETVDLEESISIHRCASSLCPEDHHARHEALHGLGASLLARFEQDGDVDILNEAVMLYRDGLRLLPECRPGRSTLLHGLACSLLARFERNDDGEDLNEAISLHREGLNLRGEEDAARSASLHGLGNTLLARFRQRGDRGDLDEAISHHRLALDLRPLGHPDRSASIYSLGNSLIARFEIDKSSGETLEEAIALHRAALNLRPDGHPARCASLHGLGNSLMVRFEQNTDAKNLESVLNRVVGLHHSALALHRAGQRHRSRKLLDRALSLLMQETTDDFNEAVALHRAALTISPEGRRSESMMYLANSLTKRFRPERRLYSLDSSIPIFRKGFDSTPEDHFGHSLILFGLLEDPPMRLKNTQRQEDIEESIGLLSNAANHTFSPVLLRLEAAHRWATLGRAHKDPTTLTAYKVAAALLQRALTIRPTLITQHELLTRKTKYTTIGSDAAAYAIQKGDLTTAVELVEQGRTLLWSQMRGWRTPLNRLMKVNKPLAERFRDVSDRLHLLMTSSKSDGLYSNRSEQRYYDDTVMGRTRLLSEELEAIINEVREVPGFEDFLQAEPFEKLQQAASKGPIVILNQSEFRCDALVILARTNDPCVCVPLDKDWYSDAANLYEDLERDLDQYSEHSVEFNRTLRRVLKVVWDRVVSKVSLELKRLGFIEGSRIWWYPTSVMSTFPLHAAGPYQTVDGHTKYFLDDYVSSYLPMLKTLISARASIRSGTPKFLLVGDMDLPGVKAELNAIRRHRRVDQCLTRKRATPEAVLKELQKTEWVHFACHAFYDQHRPFGSSFSLPGGGLTLLDIVKHYFPRGQFAYLGACSTADQLVSSAMDESIHLASGMLFSGFRSVVGTRWKMLDKDGPVLAAAFYEYLRDDLVEEESRFERAAAALRNAVLLLRSQNDFVGDGEGDATTHRWANLVHIGA